ncbi:MAG: thioredoxin domain-containing protein [Verrucomicrobiales bacterium]|nr:thioredoxin domain-containing protein [Verrucomicrobiales bacterium]
MKIITTTFLAIFSLLPTLMSAEKTRQPLPSPEAIAQLPKDGGKEFNRLIFSQSPYLLQHARNPVNWYPWSEEAFAEAKKQNKPIFLSIGYTTCHWCHVMEHESFEDQEVADKLNAGFICIKVDREERPDIDEVYMTVTQGMTGSGGWPMTIVMTPEKKPFFAGTYFPKEDRGNRAGLMTILDKLTTAWKDRRADIDKSAEQISQQLQSMVGGTPGEELQPSILTTAYQQFEQRYDATNGGFSSAPKFPMSPNLMFLMRHAKRSGDQKALDMVSKTLTEMRKGGVFDQVGLGFHRYSTDPVWLTPHFEKMLYDQALLTMAYLEGYQATGNEAFAQTAREILTYVLRDMTAPDGGFYSAEDADSEGEEGTFYVWTIEEVKKILGEEDGILFAKTYNIKPSGNFKDEASGRFTGTNIPHLTAEIPADQRDKIEALRQKLFAVREKRIHPQKDDKILTDWNGLMIAALARAGQVLDDPSYTAAAKKAAHYVLTTLSDKNGRLLKRSRLGKAGLTAHLEDYAFVVWGLLDLYEASLDPHYLAEAIRLNDLMLKHFKDPKGNGFFMTADDSEQLLVRSKKLYGGAIPSGNAVAVLNLTRLHRMTANDGYEKEAYATLKAFSGEIAKAPSAFPVTLLALDFLFGPSHEIVISGQLDRADTQAMLAALRKPFLPNKVLIFRPEKNPQDIIQLAPYTKTQTPLNSKATAYVCQDFACQLPTTDIKKMLEFLQKK